MPYLKYGVEAENFIAMTLNDLQELLGADLRNIKGQSSATGGCNRQPSQKLFIGSTNPIDSKSSEASTSLATASAVGSASLPSPSRATEVRLELL